LRLVGEYLAAARVHEHLELVDVIDAGASVVAERLDMRKVFEVPTLGTEEGLVGSEIVGVAMDVGDRFAEVDELVPQLEQEFLETVKRTTVGIGFGERLRIAQRLVRCH
jgi:hypothetical protein